MSMAADAWWGRSPCAARAAHPMTKPMAEDAGAAYFLLRDHHFFFKLTSVLAY